MSGIYGIYRYDGAPVDPGWMERMKAAMAYYGPDGGGSKIDGPVGVGHLLLEVNPEDAFEKQPMRGERGWVVCTARLDNRDSLLEAFSIPTSQAPEVPDGRLVGLAFDRWGQDVCQQLQGDWSLAAWDAKERRLLVALNACGDETLYYYAAKGFVAFASSMKALLALPGAVKDPDFLRLAGVLVCWNSDPERTAYVGFRRLIWAHKMIATSDGQTRVGRFWSPEGRESFRNRRDEEYLEEFLDLYRRAVRSCLRSARMITVALSGGRDSGSVVTLAAPILASHGRELTAYTYVPFFSPDGAGKWRLGNEWNLAHETAIMAGPNVKHVAIDARDYSVIQGIEHFLDIHDGPSHGTINQYWCQAIADTVSSSGSRVLLSGRTGNATVSWSGNGSALMALIQGNPATALRLFFQAESNPWLMLKRQILKPVLTPARRFLRRAGTPSESPWRSYSALNVHLAEELNLDAKMREHGYDPTFTPSPLTDYRPHFFSPDNNVGASIESELAAGHSYAHMDPTASMSLVEFILRVPDDQFCRKGELGVLLKRAFEGKMPHEVLYSRQKGLQAADVGHRIVREMATFRDSLDSLESVPAARDVLDLPLLHRCLKELEAKVDPDSTDRAESILLRGLGVGIFLRRLNDAASQVLPSPC